MKVVITGATKGLGRATADLFASQGADLALCARTEKDLEAYLAELRQAYPEQQFIGQIVDVRQKAQVQSFATFIQEHWDQIDLLLNNAGVFLPGEILNEDAGNLELMVETNLYSAYYLTRALVPMMLSQKKGHIFNMCSIASVIAYPNGGSYSISKFALLGFSKVLREELKPKGIKVTSILPGATWSASWEGVDLPRERLMEAEDIAQSIWSIYNLSPSAVVEDIILRPQLGDL